MKILQPRDTKSQQTYLGVSVFQTEGKKIIHPSITFCNMYMPKCQKQKMKPRNVNTVKNNIAFHWITIMKEKSTRNFTYTLKATY